jgi:hypothetical protein
MFASPTASICNDKLYSVEVDITVHFSFSSYSATYILSQSFLLCVIPAFS